MRIRPLKFRQRRHLDRNFWYTRRLLRKQSVRRQPGSSVASLHVLAKADVDRIVILRDITIDIVEAVIANLRINFSIKRAQRGTL